jgi:hypothetical protein
MGIEEAAGASRPAMSRPGLITSHLAALAAQLPGPVVEELADGLASGRGAGQCVSGADDAKPGRLVQGHAGSYCGAQPISAPRLASAWGRTR